jgi:RNA polymerase sigma factor (sigma-70 family)
MNLVVQAFRFAAELFFFSNAADKSSPQLFAKVNHFFVLACCTLMLTVSINLDILKYFLASPEYWEGLSIVPILLLAYLFLGTYYNFSVWFKLSDKTYFGTFITIGGAVITIVLNYLLIPSFGYMGSSWATLACYFSMTLACYVLGQKYFPIPFTELTTEEDDWLERVMLAPEEVANDADAARQLVARLLDMLTPPARLIIQLLEIEDRSVKEISKLTGWSVPLVKVRAFRARAEMRKCLARIAREKYL